MKKLAIIISSFLYKVNVFSQTQYDYYEPEEVFGGIDSTIKGIIIIAIIVIIAIVVFFIAAGVMKIYYMINPSADPEVQWQKFKKRDEKILEEKRAKAVPVAIDLGLSVKWASFNLGAYKSNDIGILITWGNNTSEHPQKITDTNEVGIYSGNLSYDAATYKLGKGWRIPTEKECDELISKCQWEYHEKDGIKGYLVTGPSGKSIFLPYNQLDKTGGTFTYAAYWTSTPSYSDYGKSNMAKYLRISPKYKVKISICDLAIATSCNFGVRAVYGDVPKKTETVTLNNKILNIDDDYMKDIDIDNLKRMSEIQSSDKTRLGLYNKETTIIDEFKVVYSKDGKRLIDASQCTVKEYYIKEGTEIICENAFQPPSNFGCSHGNSGCRLIELPSSIKYIGFNALKCNCDYINKSKFYEIQGPLLIDLRKRSIIKSLDTHITKLNIGEGIISIGVDAFRNCRELKEIELPASLIYIKDSAFRGCEKLLSINFPRGLQLIDDSAFYGCCSLKNIHLVDSIHIIERCAFGGCNLLNLQSLPCELKKIGDRAFCSCKYISAKLPETLDELGDAPFSSFSIDLMSNSNRFQIIDGLLIDMQKKELIQLVDDQIKAIEIPDYIVSINSYAFASSKIEKITIKNPNTKLGECAFFSCKQLTHIELPANLKEIPSHSFAYCESLEFLALPESIEIIRLRSFCGCKKLITIELNHKLRRIERAAFEFCQNLISIDVPESVELIDNAFEYSGVKMFNYNARNAEIKFSTKSLSQIIIGEKVEVLPMNLFAFCKMKQITIPENVRLIKKDCFKNAFCEKLYIKSTAIEFENDWISKVAYLTTIYVRAEVYNVIAPLMPPGFKIKKIYPHKFLFFKWI